MEFTDPVTGTVKWGTIAIITGLAGLGGLTVYGGYRLFKSDRKDGDLADRIETAIARMLPRAVRQAAASEELKVAALETARAISKGQATDAEAKADLAQAKAEAKKADVEELAKAEDRLVKSISERVHRQLLEDFKSKPEPKSKS